MRLREPVVIHLVMFGMTLAWTHVVLGRDALGSYGPAVVTLNALVLVIPGDIAALVSGRRRFARARLEALGLGMIWLLAGMITFAQYRLMLEASLRDDTMVAQLVWKLIVLITSVLIPRPARMSDADSARPAPDPGVHGRGRSRLGFHRPR